MEKLRTETYNNWNKNIIRCDQQQNGEERRISVKTEREKLPNLKSIEKINQKKKNQQKDRPSATYESITKDLCH